MLTRCQPGQTKVKGIPLKCVFVSQISKLSYPRITLSQNAFTNIDYGLKSREINLILDGEVSVRAVFFLEGREDTHLIAAFKG